MSRAGYSDDADDQWAYICWRGAVTSSIRGKRGQAFLKEMLAALDGMVFHELIANDLEKDGAVCALGAVGRRRQLDMSGWDPHDYETIAGRFGITGPLAREIVFVNDEWSYGDTPRQRWERMRKWIADQIREPALTTGERRDG